MTHPTYSHDLATQERIKHSTLFAHETHPNLPLYRQRTAREKDVDRTSASSPCSQQGRPPSGCEPHLPSHISSAVGYHRPRPLPQTCSTKKLPHHRHPPPKSETNEAVVAVSAHHLTTSPTACTDMRHVISAREPRPNNTVLYVTKPTSNAWI